MTFRCSDDAAERHDPPLGTAPPQHDWLLVEHPGPWPVTAPFGADLPTPLLRELGHPELRILFVRRHGRAGAADSMTGPRRWFRSRAGAVHSGRWERPDDLLASLGDDRGEPYADPLLLVCTHGVHDACCAIKGRPVAEALARRWPDATWECSHLGGDRFAPNVLLLPDLACYGGMPADAAVSTLEAHLAGHVQTRWLRGVAGRHPAEQVALGVVLDRWGPAPVTSAAPRLVTQDGTFDAGRWTVEVLGTDPLPPAVRVVIASGRRAEALLTCRTARPTRALQWDVVSVTTRSVDEMTPSGDR
ncbi:sucrase ferredoxin [Nocardioides oleivorans]|uniref:Sucrase ferredoxin n=1 Tax=Nocardioides oleivorans TaxID=273676 RepID=A0A4Q2RSW7_9ACTN|nr:sucrase ferredoxin [Nocardioides oleivorans]RYB92077.1 sucrase ferredoxin [Nocardioides oleivorans]